MLSVPEKPRKDHDDAFNAKRAKEDLMAMQFAKPCHSKMPLQSAVKGNKSTSYRRDLIGKLEPDLEQNRIVENLQVDLTNLAHGECCSKSKYCHRSYTCKGI